LFGGNRSGKTEEGAEYCIRKALEKPNQRIWCCAETEAISISIQQRKIWSQLPKHLLKYAFYDQINGFRNSKIIFKNGSYLAFKTYQQGVISYSSDDIDLIWNDEEPNNEIVKEQRMRLLDRDGEMIFTMTSLKGVTDLIDDISSDYEIIKSEYAELADKTLPRIAKKDDIYIFFMWTTENPYINQGRVKSDAKLMSSQEILSRIYGMPINLTGKVYPTFSHDIHILPQNDMPYDEPVTLYHVLDPHDRKPWAMGWFAVNRVGTGFMIDEYPNRNFNEIISDNKTYEEYAQIIKVKEAAILDVFRANGVHRRIIDPNSGNCTERKAKRDSETGIASTTPKKMLQALNLTFHDGIDIIEAGHLQVRQKLYYEMKDGEFITKPKFYISDRCHNAIRHMSKYSHKDPTTTDGDVRDKIGLVEKHKDFCLVGNTLIRTPKGQIIIKDIKIGDYVETDVGLRKVTASRITGYNSNVIKVTFSDGRILCGTPNHRVFLKNGKEIPLDLLRYGDIMDVWENQKTNIQKQKHAHRDAVTVAKVEPNSKKTVYNLTVEGRHRYYANDILVSNCDVIRYFWMDNPRFIKRSTFNAENEFEKAY